MTLTIPDVFATLIIGGIAWWRVLVVIISRSSRISPSYERRR